MQKTKKSHQHSSIILTCSIPYTTHSIFIYVARSSEVASCVVCSGICVTYAR